jgi:hypothetical protein
MWYREYYTNNFIPFFADEEDLASSRRRGDAALAPRLCPSLRPRALPLLLVLGRRVVKHLLRVRQRIGDSKVLEPALGNLGLGSLDLVEQGELAFGRVAKDKPVARRKFTQGRYDPEFGEAFGADYCLGGGSVAKSRARFRIVEAYRGLRVAHHIPG